MAVLVYAALSPPDTVDVDIDDLEVFDLEVFGAP